MQKKIKDDTISRQDAIDAILDLTDFVSVIELFEYVEEHDLQDKRSGGTIDAIDAVLLLPSAQPEPHWIQCSERLPEPNQYVLISVKGEVDVDWIEIDYTGYGCWYRCMKDVMNVDAWMPLPEPWGRRTK